ncbi:CHAT domain-containing protein [Scytonema sp. NUACC21]
MHPGLSKKLQSFLRRVYKRRSLFLAVLLFIFSSLSPVVAAKIPAPNIIVQAQQDGKQLANQASQLYRNEKFAEAAALWEQTAAFFASKGDGLNQAMALSNLSLTYQKLGQWERATKVIEDSLTLLKNQPKGKEKLKIQAQTLDILGYLQKERGKSADALKTWQEATQIYSKIHEPLKVSQSKVNQAQAMQDSGLYRRACDTLLEVLSQEIGVQGCENFGALDSENLAKKIQELNPQKSSLPAVIAFRSLGEVMRFEGQFRKSEILVTAAQNLAQKLKYSQELAAIYLSLGNTARDIYQTEVLVGEKVKYEEKVLNSYQQATELSSAPSTKQQAQLNLLSFLLELNTPDSLQQAQEIGRVLSLQLTTLPPSHSGVYQQINLAQNLIQLAQKDSFVVKSNSQQTSLDDIDQILVRAVEQAKSLGDTRAEAYALGNRGKLYELSGKKQNLSQAEELTKQALSLGATFEYPDISYQFFQQLGRIRKAQGDIPDAISAYTKAYDALQSLRNDLVAINPEFQFSFRDSVEPVYRELVELDLRDATTLKQAGKNEATKERLIQARNVIESLQVAELNNFFREACITSIPRQIDEVDPSTAVLYTIVFNNQLNVILSLPNQKTLNFYTTPIKSEEFQETVEQIQRSLKSPDSDVNQFTNEYYKKLYGWLIQPLETELTKSKIKTLVFVLDENLRNIPMTVLYDGNQYLVQKYAIAVTPSLQLVNPKRIAQINLRAITAGLSQVSDEFKSDFEPLRNVELELKTIQKVGISDRLLLNEQFTSRQIQQQVAAFRIPPIVHLATHGQFSSKADETFILSWDRRINVKQLGNMLRSNPISQEGAIELLVLSACETAVGDNRAALGLAGVAVRAGARSTLATLWRVEDKSTANIMAEFYRQLEQAKKNNTGKAEALRLAQLSLLEGKEYRHPHYWAPFVLVGNWQ